MDFNRIWKSMAAGLCGSVAHSGLMALKSWAGLFPSFQPYVDLQHMLTALVGSAVHPVVPWLLSYLNGSVVLGFLFGYVYRRLPGRAGAMKGAVFGLVVWILMGLTLFPALGKGLFAMQTEFGVAPSLFSLLMVLTYSVTLGIAYSVFNPERRERSR